MPRSAPMRRFRLVMGLFIAGLVASGVTAFPLLAELKLLVRILGLGNATSPEGYEGLQGWILTVRFGLEEVYARHPWIGYGTDWLGFGHLVIALFFIGPFLQPQTGRANIRAGLAACAGVIPLALIAGEVRGIPLASRLIDCSFGLIGGLLLLYCLKLLPEIEADIDGKICSVAPAADC